MSPERRSSLAVEKPAQSPVMMVVVGMAGAGVLILAAMVFSMSGTIGGLERKKVDSSELADIRKSIKDLDGLTGRVEEVDAKVGRRLDAWGKNLSDVSKQLDNVLNEMAALRTENREKDAAVEQKLALLSADLQTLKRDVATAEHMASEASKKPTTVAAKTDDATPDANTDRRLAKLERQIDDLEKTVRDIPRVNEESLRKLVDETIDGELGQQVQDEIRKFFEDMRNRRPQGGGRQRPGGDN